MTAATLAVDSMLSANLSLAEFLHTKHAQFDDEQFDPPTGVLLNARRHAVDLWQPARELVGAIRVGSGYRCAALNSFVGGAKQSAHILGLATDNQPLEMDVVDAFMRVSRSALPFDRLILEQRPGDRVTWIHMQSPAHGVNPRRLLFMKWPDSDFEVFHPADPRVQEASG